MRLAKGKVMQAEFGNGLAGAETEVFNYVDVLFGGPFGDMRVLGDGGCGAGENEVG